MGARTLTEVNGTATETQLNLIIIILIYRALLKNKVTNGLDFIIKKRRKDYNESVHLKKT